MVTIYLDPSCPPETERKIREDAAARGQPVIPSASAIDAIMSDVCDLPGNYDPADPNVVMMTLDDLHAILESHLSKE